MEDWYALRLWGRILERRDGYDVFDQGGSSAPCGTTPGLPRLEVMAAIFTAIVVAGSSILYWEKRMVKMARL